MAHLELQWRGRLLKLMRDRGFHAVPHEDRATDSTPDVSFSGTFGREPDLWSTGGWIELKCLDVPKRQNSPVRADHFTIGQKQWLNHRGRMGQNCWTLIKLSDGAVGVFGHWGCLPIGTLPYAALRGLATAWWPPGTRSGAVVGWFIQPGLSSNDREATDKVMNRE